MNATTRTVETMPDPTDDPTGAASLGVMYLAAVDDLIRAQGAILGLRHAVNRIREFHVQAADRRWCQECVQRWPCATRRITDAAAERPGPGVPS